MAMSALVRGAISLPVTLARDLRIRDEADRKRLEENLAKLNAGRILMQTFVQRAGLRLMPVTWPMFLSMLPEEASRLAGKRKRQPEADPAILCVAEHLPYASLLRLAGTCKANLVGLQPMMLGALERARAQFARVPRSPAAAPVFTLHDEDGNTMQIGRLIPGVTSMRLGKRVLIAINRECYGPYVTVPMSGSKIYSALTVDGIFSYLAAADASRMWFKQSVGGKVVLFLVCEDLLDGLGIEAADETRYVRILFHCFTAWTLE